MTSINSALTNTNWYSQLFGQSSSTQTTQINSLADALDASDATTTDSGSSDDSAFLLDLSPEAQAYMNGTASTTGTTGTASTTSTGFTLTTDQQDKITAIVEKYKDSPYTQDTFSKIESDLTAAGLDPQRLSAIDQVKSFNPTSSLINALNGNSTDLSTIQTASDEQTKANNYTQAVLNQWQSISTTAASANYQLGVTS